MQDSVRGYFITTIKVYNTDRPKYILFHHAFMVLTTGIIIATVASFIASQALISGVFTLVNEAMKLHLWPA